MNNNDIVDWILANPIAYPGKHNHTQPRTIPTYQPLKPKDQFQLILKAIGEHVHDNYMKGNGVNIPKFGTFSCEILSPTTQPIQHTHNQGITQLPKSFKTIRPCFIVDSQLMKHLTRHQTKDELNSSAAQCSVYQQGYSTAFCNAQVLSNISYVDKATTESIIKTYFEAIHDLITNGYDLHISFDFIDIHIVNKSLQYKFKQELIAALNTARYTEKFNKSKKPTNEHWKTNQNKDDKKLNEKYFAPWSPCTLINSTVAKIEGYDYYYTQQQEYQMNTDQYFIRQELIEDWKQVELRQQIVLILGVGGIGSVSMINLLRLGVKKIILVDYDKVDSHNLNRQMIYQLKDVNVQKVEASLANAQIHNIGETIVEGHDFNAVEHWDRVVQLAKEAHVIFNCIDYGDYWDAAVSSLCLHLNIPMIIAGTFAQSLMAEIYVGTPCYVCSTDGLKPEFLNQITTDLISSLKSIAFLPPNQKPIGKSHQVLCSTAGNFATQLYVNYVNNIEQSRISKKSLFYLTTFEIVNFPVEPKHNCELCHYQAPPKPQDIIQELVTEMVSSISTDKLQVEQEIIQQ